MISLFLRKTHIWKTPILLDMSVDSGPIGRARARRRKHLNPPTAPIGRARYKSRKSVFYLSEIDVFKVRRRSGALSRILEKTFFVCFLSLGGLGLALGGPRPPKACFYVSNIAVFKKATKTTKIYDKCIHIIFS